MGGTAFGKDVSSRVDAVELYSILYYLHESFKNYSNDFINLPIIIPFYSTKDSFGDMDLLYTMKQNDPEKISKIISEVYPVEGMIRNGPVTSYLISIKNNKQFQLDFISSSEEDFNFSYKYFAFNDRGNLIGRIAHRLGLKFGHDGLKYVQRNDNDQVIYNHTLTKNFELALMLLDLDYTVTEYRTLEDIFEWIFQSKYFDFNSFDLNNRSHYGKVRDKKRPTYNKFLEFCKENGLDKVHIQTSKQEFLSYLFYTFPPFKEAYDLALLKDSNHKLYKSYINGNVVREHTGLEGKELGEAVSKVKEMLPIEQFMALDEYDRKLAVEYVIKFGVK